MTHDLAKFQMEKLGYLDSEQQKEKHKKLAEENPDKRYAKIFDSHEEFLSFIGAGSRGDVTKSPHRIQDCHVFHKDQHKFVKMDGTCYHNTDKVRTSHEDKVHPNHNEESTKRRKEGPRRSANNFKGNLLT